MHYNLAFFDSRVNRALKDRQRRGGSVVLQMFMGDDDHFPSSGLTVPLPFRNIKKHRFESNRIMKHFFLCYMSVEI